MKKFFIFVTMSLLAACGTNPGGDDNYDITNKFKSTWNIYEGIQHNDDGSITYYALPWGGLVGNVREHNMAVDWSGYESIRFDFKEPTKVPVQVMISEKLKTWGKEGITSLTCYFDGHNLHSVEEVALQASDTTALNIASITLTPGNAKWESSVIWEGKCVQGNWQNGFVINPEKFTTAYEGDKLEIIFTTDKSDPQVTYWMLKTIYSGTEQTLEGNDNELNKWGTATVAKEATSYRIVLTENDIVNLREKGLFINGYYNTVTRCNLLKRVYDEGQGEGY